MKTLLLCVLFALPAHADLYTEIHGNGIYTVAQRGKAQRKLNAFRREIEEGRFLRLAQRSEHAIDGMIRIAKMNLRRKGHHQYADQLGREWEQHRGMLIVLSLNIGYNNRPIGDYAPLSEWLAGAVDKIIELLTWDIAHALRLTDLATLNYGLRYVFTLVCEHGVGEFLNHFADDPKYRAVFPVVAYWVASITCSIATFGAGYFFICSPIAMLVEFGASKIAPPLGEKIHGWACN